MAFFVFEEKRMSRPTDRGVRMDCDLRVRTTPSDMEQLKEIARSRGTNMSTLVRMTLIDQGLIKA